MPYQGKLMLFGGDLRQIIPVVIEAIRANIVAKSLSSLVFQPHCHFTHLRINMQLMDLNLSNHKYQRLHHFAN